MRILLDTHVFLWWITNSIQLSAKARKIIGDGNNELFFSAASGWEIAIKAQLGKLQVTGDLERFIKEQLHLNGIDDLPVELSHTLRVHSLPRHHQDPFDRIIIAQSQLEKLPILTSDPQINKYAVEVIW